MDKMTIEQIEKEIYGDYLIDDLMKSCWKELVKKNKELDDELVEEITKKEPEWVRDRRLEYLKLKLDELNKEYFDRYKEIQAYRNKIDRKENMSLHGVYNLFADMMENERNTQKSLFNSSHTPWRSKTIIIERFLPDIVCEIDKINFEIKCWENPELDYNAGQYTEAEIEMARNADPSMFMEFERNDGDRMWSKCLSNDENTASLCYYRDSKRFHCFSCGANFNCIDLVMKLYNTDFRSAITLILNKK